MSVREIHPASYDMREQMTFSSRFTRTCLILLCLLLAGCLKAAAQTEIPVTYVNGDWVYFANETGLTLKDYLGNDPVLKIPSEIAGQPVTELGNDLFAGQMWLKSVTIPGTVTKMGNNVFNGCTGLEEATLSFVLTTIPTGTFRNCIHLKEISIPRTVTSINSFAFANCVELKQIMLNNVRSIGESAFDGCKQLDSIICSNLTSIGAYAFRDTAWMEKQTDEFVFLGKGILIQWNGSGKTVEVPWNTIMLSGTFDGHDELENVILPNTVRNIGQYAFRNAVNLKSITIPPYVTSIGGSAFEGCRSLESIKFPNTLRSLGGSAFRGCSLLTEVTIPFRVTTLPSYVFGDCRSLREVYVPETLTQINQNAFAGSPLAHVYIPTGTEVEALLIENGIPYSDFYHQYNDLVYFQEKDGVRIIDYLGSEEIVEIPSSIDYMPVKWIDKGAFQNKSSVRKIILPQTIYAIGDWAFAGMPRLESVEMNAGLHQVGNYVFKYSRNLKEIKFPASITTIGAEPVDRGPQIVVCAKQGVLSHQILSDQGYAVRPYEACEAIREAVALAQSAEEDDPEEQAAEGCGSGPTAIRIPDEMIKLDADLFQFTDEEIYLFVPETVTEFDESLAEMKNLTFISRTGTPAEAFAAENGLPFLIEKDYRIF